MAKASYGGYIWSDHEAQDSTPHTGLKLGIAGLAGAGVAYGLTHDFRARGPRVGDSSLWDDLNDKMHGRRGVDYVAASARMAGNLSPFQLGNTFRIPDFLSPFTSLDQKKMHSDTLATTGQGMDPAGRYHWGAEFLESESTYDWLKYTSGKSHSELAALGLSRGSGVPGRGPSLTWTPASGKNKTLGELWVNKPDGTRGKLAENVFIAAAGEEVIDPLSGKTGVNRMMASMFAAADMYAKSSKFNEADVMRNKDAGISSKFIPVAGPNWSASTADELLRSTTYVRGMAAFEMGRANRLLGTVFEQVGGEFGDKFAKNILGMTPEIINGPASHMFARFGGRAIAAGAAMTGVATLDWLRRENGIGADLFSTGVISTGLAAGVAKMGYSPRAALAVGGVSAAAQVILPGFDQGLMQGIATTGALVDTYIRGNVVNPFHHWRRTVEGFLPGFTGWETGALLSVGAVAAAALKVPGLERMPLELIERFGPDALGLTGVSRFDVKKATDNVRDVYWEQVNSLDPFAAPNSTPKAPWGRMHLLDRLEKDAPDKLRFINDLNAQWGKAEELIKHNETTNPMNDHLFKRLQGIEAKYSGASGNLVDGLLKQTEGLAAQAWYGFFGADASTNTNMKKAIKNMGFGGPTGRWGRLATIGAAVFGAHQIIFGGALGSMETTEDLKKIYSGEKLVEIKKSRFWEGGGTPFEGGQTSYFRPHAYSLMMNRTREKGIWGSDEGERSPLGKFFTKNFTYDLERENYYSRPYPISNQAFSDVPIIGGVLGSTIGRIIKPAKLMHVDEWSRLGEGGDPEFAHVFRGSRMEPAYDLGAQGPGIPTSPFATDRILAGISYQSRELAGLTGFVKNTAQNIITGSQSFGTDSPVLAESGDMTSWRRRFWEGQTGGAFFSNELIRRFLPNDPGDSKTTNPIGNTMPSWLPEKFRTGDPYRSIEWGEARLPGAGYASRFKELEGLDPEDYPMLHKFAILSDVAASTKEYDAMKRAVYEQRAQGFYNERQEAFIDQVDKQHKAVMAGYSFERVHENAYNIPGSRFVRSFYFGIQKAIRAVAAPGEYMVPMGFRPVQKLMNNRDPIEQYEYERLYGTPLAFWDKPWRDWFRPAMYSTMSLAGFEGKPLWRKEADETNEHFDKVEYIKWMRVAEEARMAGDGRAAASAEWKAGQTRTGVNPMGNPLSIYWSLPDEDRKFFDAFSKAKGSDRGRILQMVPEDQTHLYQAIWNRVDSGDETLWAGSKTGLDNQYMAAQLGEAHSYMQGRAMPPDDFIGWHADVDMDDIKVRYVENMGRELHDFGLWESQLKQSMSQPFLEGSDDFMHNGVNGGLNSRIRSEIHNMIGGPGQSPSLQIAPTGGGSNSMVFTYNDDRHNELYRRIQGGINGY